MRRSIYERLEEKYMLEPNSGCWLWIGAISPSPTGTHPYGVMQGPEGRLRMAHRVCYEAHKGPIPEAMQLDHKCRVTLCVNPDHLEPVTPKENISRGRTGAVAAKRQLDKTHCPSGHAYDGENVRFKQPSGRRVCRICEKAAGARYRARRAA